MQRDVFQAIADPTRREIIDLLAGQSLPVNEVAENFEISRPAVSKHIKILNECGMVVIRKKGRKRYCRTDPRKLKEVADWAERYRKFWNKNWMFWKHCWLKKTNKRKSKRKNQKYGNTTYSCSKVSNAHPQTGK